MACLERWVELISKCNGILLLCREMTHIPRNQPTEKKVYIFINKANDVMVLLTLEMALTWIGSLLYSRSCSPRITRWFLGLEEKITKTSNGSFGIFLVVLDTVESYLRHTAVSSGNNPVLVDQGSTTEVESPAILRVRRCIRAFIE